MPYSKLLILFFIALSSIGCNAETAPQTQGITRASDLMGLIQHARVTLSVMEEDRIYQVDTTFTGNDGSFSFQPTDSDQPLLVEVSPAPDGRTRAVCEQDTGCGDYANGELMPLSPGFHILAVVTPEELREGRVAVNPYTHLVAHRMTMMPGLITSRLIDDARRKVTRDFGIEHRFWEIAAAEDKYAPRKQSGMALAMLRAGSASLSVVSTNTGSDDTARNVGACEGVTGCSGSVAAQSVAFSESGGLGLGRMF